MTHSLQYFYFNSEFSSALSRAKAFLPGMAQADRQLKDKLNGMDEEQKKALQVDHVDEDAGDAFVEMNVGLMKEQQDEDWSEDSDPDSPASPAKEDHGNGFTTDSDSDSTIRLVLREY